MLSVLINIKNFQHSNCELVYVIAVSTRFRNTVHLVKGKVFKAPTILRTLEYPQQHGLPFGTVPQALRSDGKTLFLCTLILRKSPTCQGTRAM